MKNVEIEGSLLARNTLLNFLGHAVPLVVGVVTIPFIVCGLGTERFGLLSLAWVVLGYFTIFDLGLGRATTKYVAEALGKGEEDQIPRLVWTAVTVQALFGLLGTIVLTSITPLLVEHVLNIPVKLVGEAKGTFYLLALSIPVILVSSSFSGVLEAKQRFDLVNAVRIPASALTFLLPLVGLMVGLHLPGIVALILASKFIALSAFVLLSFQTFPSLKRFSAQSVLFPRLFRYGGWVTVSSVITPVFTYLERFLIASFISVGALAFYAAPYEVISRVVILPVSIAMTLFPVFSYYGVNNRVMTKEIFHRPLKYILFVMTPVSVIFVVFARQILALWLGEQFAQSSSVILQILTITFFLNSFAYVPFIAIQGVGRPDLKAKLDLVQLPIFVALCWWLIPELGLIGAALAKLWVTTFDVLCLFWMAKSMLGLPTRELFGQRLSKALIISSVFALTVFASKIVSKILVLDILILTGLTGAYLFLFLKTVMDDKDWSAILSVQKLFLRRTTIV
ncbi:MAG: flippase [Nitrospirota bacterium]